MQSLKKKKVSPTESWSQRQEDQEFDIIFSYTVRAARDTCRVTGVFPRD